MGSRIRLPGFGFPLGVLPEEYEALPNGVDYELDDGGYHAYGLVTRREILMMQVMNSITEKNNWHRKVFDESITSKWREEISSIGDEHITDKMMDWVIKELQWKAETFKRTGWVNVFDSGVFKSDSAVSEEMRRSLREAAALFENVPEEQKDYHPGSDMEVLDLVHPSLFPLIYGRSRILPDRTIDLDNCLGSVGEGVLLPIPTEKEVGMAGNSWAPQPFSRKFQWLPCNVKFDDEDGCRIVSYINNAHPAKHRALYEAVEKVLQRTIPLWDQTLSTTGRFLDKRRIEFDRVEFGENPDPEPQRGDADSDDYWERHEQWEKSTPIVMPEPGEFEPPEFVDEEIAFVNLREMFADKGFQVIVKLANIELTPDKPDYEGGSWHIEGQLNERICASAIYYYDCENITESRLAFRQRADSDNSTDIGYPQDDHRFLQAIFGFGPDVDGRDDTNVTQDLGSVVCRQGRLITFPNTLQHCVSPFSLDDRTKPGHRKILALFLIHPNLRIISTANIPPQQEHWAKEKNDLVRRTLSSRLPRELQDVVAEDFHPPITMDEAKEYRLELMAERSVKTDELNRRFETGQFNLCEH